MTAEAASAGTMSDPVLSSRHGAPGPLPEGEPPYLVSEDGFPVFVPDPGRWARPLSLPRREQERLRSTWDHLARTVAETYDCETRLRGPVASAELRASGEEVAAATAIDEDGLAWLARPAFAERDEPSGDPRGIEAHDPAGGDPWPDTHADDDVRYLQSKGGLPPFVAELGHWCLPLSLPSSEQDRLRRAWDHFLKTVDDPYDCERRLNPALAGLLEPSAPPAWHPAGRAEAPERRHPDRPLTGDSDAVLGPSWIGAVPEGARGWFLDEDGLASPYHPVFVEWEAPGEIFPDDAVRVSVTDTGGGFPIIVLPQLGPKAGDEAVPRVQASDTAGASRLLVASSLFRPPFSTALLPEVNGAGGSRVAVILTYSRQKQDEDG